LVVVVGLVAAVGLALWPRGGARSEQERELRAAQVEAADFYITVRVTGVMEAAQVNPVVCMVGGASRGRGGGGTKIVWKLDDGARVKEGDIILKLDATEAQDGVSDLEVELAEAEENVRSAEADATKKLENARAGLKKAEEALRLARAQNKAALEKAEAELEYQEKEREVARGEVAKRKRLFEEKLIPRTEVESAEDEERQRQFAWEKAQRALARAEEDVAMVEDLRQMDIEKAKLELAEAETSLDQSVANAKRSLEATRVNLEDARSSLDATEVRAPASGLLLLERNWRGEPLRVGDDVGEGRRLASVIDPADMWVRCDIPEADIERVDVGQQAAVLVPGLGGMSLPGRVKAIDNLARERQWYEGGIAGKKVFAALIELTERSDDLRPGMGATVEIKLEHIGEGMAVPVEAVFPAKGGAVVYQKRGEQYHAVPVTVKSRNELQASVSGELEVGDMVACERPPSSLISETKAAK
jgi:HlyD family secretion protein